MEAPNETGGYRAEMRATGRLLIWGLAWIATLALARFGPQLWWDPEQQPVVSWVAVVANVLVGIGWIVSFTRFLRTIDDLQRKIIQDALAVTLGVGFIGGFAWVVADAAGLIASDVDIAVFPVLLAVAFIIAIVVGKVRYR